MPSTKPGSITFTAWKLRMIRKIHPQYRCLEAGAVIVSQPEIEVPSFLGVPLAYPTLP